MLRINTIYNTQQAINYYANHLPNDDYYAKDQVLEPGWDGELSKQLNLQGKVAMQDYFSIMENKDPNTGETLTQTNRETRRAGYDLTFSFPKSLSLEYAFGNQEMLEVMTNSVQKVMKDLEKETMARVRKGGQDHDRITGNLLYVPFTHQFARPEGGVPDPHLHTHVIVANSTYDHEEKKMKAIQMGEIKSNGQFYQQTFYNYVAEDLVSRGYKLREKGKTHNKDNWYFELANWDDNTLDKFSRRTKSIEKKAAELGIIDTKSLNDLGAKTRNIKSQKFSMQDLKNIYSNRLDPEDFDKINSSKNNIIPTPQEKIDKAKESLEYSVSKNFERNSVVSYKQIVTEAMQRSVTYGVNPKWIDDEFKSAQNRGDLIAKPDNKHSLYTTKNYSSKYVKKEEEYIIDMLEEASKIKLKPINTNWEIKPDKDGFELSEEQKNAVQGILNSEDRFMVFSGKAGTGKTTTLKEIEKASNAENLQIHIFAPTTGATDTLRKEGFENANTIQSFLANPETQDKVKGQIVMIDEASLVSVPEMKKILDTAKNNDSKLILVGDSKQHNSVERGDALRLIEKKNLTKVDIYSIRRQYGKYKEATQDIARGKIIDGYLKLDQMGVIKQDRQISRLHHKAAKDYLDSQGKGMTVGLYVPTHNEGKAVSIIIRQQMVLSGKITGKIANIEILKDLNWENVVKQRLDKYEGGEKIVFHNNADIFKKNEVYTVKKDNRLFGDQKTYMQKEGDNKKLAIPVEQSKNFSVSKTENIEIAAGDKIVLTKALHLSPNKFSFKPETEKLPNGKKFVVKEIRNSGDVILKEDKKPDKLKGIIPKEYIMSQKEQNLNYGYYTTSHKGQGDTVDKAIIVASSKSLGAINDKQFYVSTTRGRKELAIYTNDKNQFSQFIQKSGQRELYIDTQSPRVFPKSLHKAIEKQKKEEPVVKKPFTAEEMERNYKINVWKAQKEKEALPKPAIRGGGTNSMADLLNKRQAPKSITMDK